MTHSENLSLIQTGSVVQYDGTIYLLWHITEMGKAQLLKPDGSKLSGKPAVVKLKWLKTLPACVYNNTFYCLAKGNKIFSLASGKIVFKAGPQRTEILRRIKEDCPFNKVNKLYDDGKITKTVWERRCLNITYDMTEDMDKEDNDFLNQHDNMKSTFQYSNDFVHMY